MEEKLRIIIMEYIENVNDVCIKLLEGLNLKSKEEFWKYKETHWGTEFEVNGIKYMLHGKGCIATNDEMFIDWDFGYGSRWCGINPWILASMLEHNKDAHVEYYDSKRIKEECEQAVLNGEMYKKYDLYYFSIPISETFEPNFPKEFDTLIIEHFDSKWIIPRNKMIDRFIRKSRRVYNHIEKSLNKYTLRFMLDGKEIYSIPYDDIGYPQNAVRIMREILINISKETNVNFPLF
ncbi:MAG: hypothetical protein K2I10_10800 [Lachnospiraceae bacterium]|nr:hypothetical protein [Lachnospiraceae bacterium]